MVCVDILTHYLFVLDNTFDYQAVLLACLVAFVSAVLYIASQNVHRASSTRLMLPSHFTIPILSPFTSVVRVKLYLW